MVNTIAFYFLCYNNKYEVENDERKLFMGWCFGCESCEGAYNLDGKGLSVSDVMLAGSKTKKRNGLMGLLLENIIQVMKQLIFIITIKMIYNILKKWALIVCECQLLGHVSILMVMS